MPGELTTMLVIFDCDGVLVDSEPVVNRVERELLAGWGAELSEREVRALFKGRVFADVARLIEQRVPRPLPADWIYVLAMETARAFRAQLREVKGVRAVIEQCLGSGVDVCVASQSSLPRVRLSLELCDLARLFGERVFTASMVARPKPAPDLFLHAARTLGVAAGECVVVEDSPSGVAAAVAAGMHVFGYAADEDAGALRAAGAEVFTEMSELAGMLTARSGAP
jgi:HAD superfamily hydrolase (TIGR01509 family)